MIQRRKRCGRCRQMKAADPDNPKDAEFSPAPGRADGFAGWCRDCVAESNRPRNRARMRAYAALRDRYPDEFSKLYEHHLEVARQEDA